MLRDRPDHIIFCGSAARCQLHAETAAAELHVQQARALIWRPCAGLGVGLKMDSVTQGTAESRMIVRQCSGSDIAGLCPAPVCVFRVLSGVEPCPPPVCHV